MAVVCPATKSVVARRYTHVNPKRNKYQGAVQGIVVEAGGRLGPAAKNPINEVVAECEMSEVARKAAASKRVWAIDIEATHAQAGIHGWPC